MAIIRSSIITMMIITSMITMIIMMTVSMMHHGSVKSVHVSPQKPATPALRAPEAPARRSAPGGAATMYSISGSPTKGAIFFCNYVFNMY